MIDVRDQTAVALYRKEMVDRYEVNSIFLDKYLGSLITHIRYVQEAGEKIGVPTVQLQEHDQSKFTDQEFPFYAKHFYGGGDPDGFAGAWLHHMNFNPHHWQHWIFPDGYSPKGSHVEGGIVEMPEIYALEMIADWMGASKTYTGSWNMHNWLIDNAPRIKLHSNTIVFISNILMNLGYGDTLNALEWWGVAANE